MTVVGWVVPQMQAQRVSGALHLGSIIVVYLGAMRMAPSRRMVSPFSIGFSTM